MKSKNPSNLNLSDEKKRIHDIHASIRFLENLHTEISVATDLSDIQDPAILKKFHEIIRFLKKETRY
jgi:uncharacterized protein YeeX (DUF496 family)